MLTDDHVAKLRLVSRFEVHLDELVHRLLVVQRALDGQVDGAAQGDQVRLRLVQDRGLQGLVLVLGWGGGTETAGGEKTACS